MESFTSEVGSCAVWVQSDSYLLVCCGEGTHPSVAQGTTQTKRRMLSRNNHTAFRYTLVYNHQDGTSGAGERAQQFRALAALRADLGLVTRHLMAAHTVHSSSSRGFNTLFGHSQAPGIPCCRHTCKQTPLHIHPKRDQTGSSMRRNLLCGLKHSIKCTTSNSDFLIQVFIKITAETQALSSNTHFLGETNP